MPPPAGPPRLPLLVSATALALLSPLELAAAASRDEVKQAIQTGLPRYDPAAYEKAQAAKAARSVPKHSPASLPEPKPAAPAAPVPGSAGEDILELPKVTVHGKADLPKRLPRSDPPVRPVKDLPPQPFESATGRDARLVRKHLTKLEQIFLGKKTALATARQAESREQKALQLNELSAAIEMQAALGLDPKAIKQLRAEYLKLYYSGPK